MKKTYTTISVDTEMRPKLEKLMLKLGKKMTFNEIMHYALDTLLEEEDFIQSMLDGNMIDNGPETFNL